MTDNNFWQTKRVCVTGGAGFLGKVVVRKLQERGVKDVFIPAIENYDLVKLEDIDRMLKDANADLIIHLAAQVGGIGANREHPAEFFYNNLMMGVQLMHRAWETGVEKFVAIGTICAYPKFTPVPLMKTISGMVIRKKPTRRMAWLKRCSWFRHNPTASSMAITRSFCCRSIFMARVITSIRSHRMLFLRLIRKCIEANEAGLEEIEVWGDGSPTREFLYVEDAAEGILLAAEKYNGSEPVNLGSGFEISIKDLVEMIADLTGYKGSLIWDASKPNGQPRRALDVNRARNYFGFQAKMDFREGLKKTIEWYRANQK